MFRHDRHVYFLDAANYPRATVRALHIVQGCAVRYLLTVELALHGITRQVELLAATNGPASDVYGIDRLGASAKGWLRRSAFGVTAHSRGSV